MNTKLPQKKTCNPFPINIETNSWGQKFSFDYNKIDENLKKKILKFMEERNDIGFYNKSKKKLKDNSTPNLDTGLFETFREKNIHTKEHHQIENKKLEKKFIFLIKNILKKLRNVYL